MVKQIIQKHPQYYDFLNAQEDNKLWRELVSLNNSWMYLWSVERNEKKAIVNSILEKRWLEVNYQLDWSWLFVFEAVISKTKQQVSDLIEA